MDREFVLHIAETSLLERANPAIDLQEGQLIQPFLREHMWIRGVDALQWVLHCWMGEWEFDQAIEDEIPIICRYYNDFLGRENWQEDDHIFMDALNKYDELKAKGVGNFAQ